MFTCRTMTHMSFAVWSCYTELTFRKARTLQEADVVVMFSEPTHSYYSTAKDKVIPGSDGSPFDGKGGKFRNHDTFERRY